MVFSSAECNFPVYSPLENKRGFCCLFLVIKVVHTRVRKTDMYFLYPPPPNWQPVFTFCGISFQVLSLYGSVGMYMTCCFRNRTLSCAVWLFAFFHFMYHWHSFVLININPSVLNDCIVFHWTDALWFNQYTIVKQLSPSFLPSFFLVKQNFKRHDNFIFVSFLVIYLGYISRYEIYWISESAHFNDKLSICS